MNDLAIEITAHKRFGDCVALAGATAAIARGSIHALVGENGAGKSTLVKLIAGLVPADRGSALAVAGREIALARWDRRAARAAGIGLVQQHGASAGTLTVVENAVLGAEPRRRLFGVGPAIALELDAAARELAAKGEAVGLPIDPHARAGELGLGAAQRAEIVSALYHGADVLILDEPTAVLAPIEVDGLFATLRALAAAGTTIAIVTHKLDEVRALADAVTVLRAGATVATFAPPLDVAAIARAMVGAEVPAAPAPAPLAADAADALALADVRAPGLGPISLRVRAGELVGVAGVDGNGQRELALAIAGLVPASGTIALAGRALAGASTGARLAAGLAYVPEDRHHGGLLLDATVADNLALGRADVTGPFAIDGARVDAFARARIAELDVRPPDGAAIARALSGGNQQKLVIGRELSRPGVRAVVAAQPTRGVDLGAVARIHDQLRAAAAAGAGVLVISADLDELLALCHRVVVLLRGAIAGERALAGEDRARARIEIGALMTGAGGDA